ncbi:MAG: PQQ-dependent sugar dehydrogenase [Phycisphaerales bacterium]
METRNCMLAAFVGAALAGAAHGQGFSNQLIVGGWDQATGVTFDANGRAYVWEKAGRVWIVENGVKSAQPLIDISEEVGDWRDFGLLGFALDPNFLTNGRIYLSYVVDYHHLMYFGTPQYNAGVNQYFVDTIDRVTRYTANPADGFHSVLPGSRVVLVGETRFNAPPITHESHGAGTLVFGEDGTLLASFGDGASFDTADVGGFRSSSSNTALQDGILTPQTDVGAMRAQMIDSLSGKVLRLDPATGDGVPSNPFYDPAQPRGARSRVWALGMRNPFRICLKPGTGSANPALGNPGVLFVGDVGWSHHEELDIVPTGGLNLGWPLFEGLEADPDYTPLLTANQFAINPLFGVGGCTIQCYRFQDLLKQEVVGTPSWPNPCNAGQQISAGTPRFEHTRPIMDWGHGEQTRVATFNGTQAAWVDIASPSSPITGTMFHVNSSSAIGGCWYSGPEYPAAYNNTLFFGDFTGGWIYNLKFNASGQPVQVEKFAEDLGPVVCIAKNPVDGFVYFVAYSYDGTSSLRRFFYGVDSPPVAAAGVAPRYGVLPATATFSSAGSADANGPVTYLWDFGDGTPPSTLANPQHTYANIEDISSTGTVVAKVYSLNPPGPIGGGSTNPETLRDGVRPSPGSSDPSTSFDTFHNGDQGIEDWIGYTFPSTRRVQRLLFQEGMEFGDGGWFDVLNVQARVNGTWVSVAGLAITPEYPAAPDGVGFQSYSIDFPPIDCTGIRLYGVPGGNDRFVSVAELRVFATPVPANKPVRFDATVTVTDNANQSAAAGTFFTGNNTPPVVSITSPANGSILDIQSPTEVPLTATVSDAEHGPGQRTCSWQLILHHNDHTHPEPSIEQCSATAVFSPHTGGPGDVIYYEVVLTVTDALGLSTTASSIVYLGGCDGIDFNNDDLFPDTMDIDDFLRVFSGGPCSNDPNCNDVDFNNDELFPDTLDIDALLSVFSGGPCLR